MNKEQIKKHKEVIQWFINNPDKGVWYKGFTGEWGVEANPYFVETHSYVQNDEYAEFRKAEDDGEQIQFRAPNHFGKTVKERNEFTDWVDTTMKEYDSSLQYSDIEFRIKPSETEFKVGDWIIDISPENSGIHQIETTTQLKQANLDTSFEKWKPKEGEWCVFWDDNDFEEYFVGRYGSIHPENKLTASENQWHYTKKYWNHVSPAEFINILKNDKELCNNCIKHK